MTVKELITQLSEYPDNFEVHLDVAVIDHDDWEGERIVRHVAGTRIQQGFNAVAIDGHSYEQSKVIGFTAIPQRR